MKYKLLGLLEVIGPTLIVAAIGLVLIGGVAAVRWAKANQVVYAQAVAVGAPAPK